MAASDKVEITIGSVEDRNNEPRDTAGGICDVDVAHVDVAANKSSPGTSRYQLNRAPFTEIKNCAVESVDSKRLRSDDESDVVGYVKPKKKKYSRIKTAASDSSQATQESASKERATEDSSDSEDDKQSKSRKDKKSRRIASSGSESSLPKHNKSIGLSSDSEEGVQSRKKKIRCIASSDDDFESSKDDNLLLVATERIEAGSSEIKVTEEERDELSRLSDSGSDDSHVSGNSQNASATSYSSYDELEEENRNIHEDLNWKQNHSNHPSPSGSGNKKMSLHEEQESLTVAKLKEIQKELKSRPEESEEAEQPRLVTLPLMSHQLQGLKFMLWRETCKNPGGIICDEMGLGKTGIAIALIADQLQFQMQFQLEKKKRRNDKHKGGTLIVTPASVLHPWSQEIEKFCSNSQLRVYNFHGKDRETKPSNLAENYDVVITTYNLVSKEFKKKNNLFRINWHRIILDEGHVIRNCATYQSSACITLSGTNRRVMTGTPIQNEEMDLFALVQFLRYAPFDQFPVWNQFLKSDKESGHQQRLDTLLDSFMLRRSKDDLEAGLIPEKSIIKIPLELSKEEQEIHDLFESFSQVVLTKFLEQRIERLGDKAAPSDHAYHEQALRNVDENFLELFRSTQFQQYDILILLLRLRQITCHPALIRESLPDDSDSDGDSDDTSPSTRKPKKRNLVLMSLLRGKLKQDGNIASKDLLKRSNPAYDDTQPSTKMLELMSRLEEKLQKKEKVIVVSSFAGFLKIIKPMLNKKDIKYEIFDGSTTLTERDRMREAINYENSGVQVLLLAMRAGGLGLNFTGANHMFILDLHWNPQLEKQVMERIHRFGQTKSVNIVKFICKNTIEERILASQIRKLEIAENALDQKGNNLSSRLTIGDMMKLFRMDEENEDIPMSLPTEDPDEEAFFAGDDNDGDDHDNLSELLGLASN